jgi:hypothetical protein
VEGPAGPGVQQPDPAQQQDHQQQQAPEEEHTVVPHPQQGPGDEQHVEGGKGRRRSGRASKRAGSRGGTQQSQPPVGEAASHGAAQDDPSVAPSSTAQQAAPAAVKHVVGEQQLPAESLPAPSAATTGARASKRRKTQLVESPGTEAPSLAEGDGAQGFQGAGASFGSHAHRRRSTAAAARHSPAPQQGSPAPGGPVVNFSSVGNADRDRYKALVKRLGGGVYEEEGGTTTPQVAGKGRGKQGSLPLAPSSAPPARHRGRGTAEEGELAQAAGNQQSPHAPKGSLAPYTHLVVGDFVRWEPWLCFAGQSTHVSCTPSVLSTELTFSLNIHHCGGPAGPPSSCRPYHWAPTLSTPPGWRRARQQVTCGGEWQQSLHLQTVCLCLTALCCLWFQPGRHLA